MTAPASPASSGFRFNIRVYYEDTDFSGSVYHASYLRFLERGRTELLRARGVDQSALFAGETGASSFFAVRSMSLEFLKPARMDDELAVETTITALGGASIMMDQRIFRHGEVLTEAKVKVAFVSGGRARRLPEGLIAKLSIVRAD